MAEEQVVTAPPAEGNGEGTPPQGSGSVPQGTNQSQEAGTVKVETAGQQVSSPTTERPKASEFYRERNKIRTLETQIRQLSEQLQKIGSTSSPSAAQATVSPQEQERIKQERLQEFFRDPIGYQEKLLAEREKQYQEKMDEMLGKRIPESIQQLESRREYDRKQQEALELIFPKGSSTDTLEQRIKSNPQKAQKIMEIVERCGLNDASRERPREIADAVLKIYAYENSNGRQNPAPALKKSAVGSTVTGTPPGAGGQKAMASLAEIQAERNALLAQKETHPDVVYTDDFKKRWDEVTDKLTKHAQELKKG